MDKFSLGKEIENKENCNEYIKKVYIDIDLIYDIRSLVFGVAKAYLSKQEKYIIIVEIYQILI